MIKVAHCFLHVKFGALGFPLVVSKGNVWHKSCFNIHVT